MILALLLAQVSLPSVAPIATPAPAPVSERVALERGLEDTQAQAKALGGTLGAVVVDLGSGASAAVQADQPLQMQSLQRLPLAVLVYRAIDDGKLQADQLVAGRALGELTARMLQQNDASAARSVLDALGGVDAANTRLRELTYYGIVIGANENGFAKPSALATLLTDLQSGTLLSPSSRSKLFALLAAGTPPMGRMRASFPNGTLIEDATTGAGIVNVSGRTFIVVAMLRGAGGDDAAREAVIGAVGRAAVDAARQFPI